MTEFEIRPARETDLDELVAILQEVLAEDRYLSAELPIDRAQRLRRWQEILSDENSAMYVACKEGRPVGEIALAAHPEYGPLFGMLLAKAYRGRGAGSALLQAALDWAKSHHHDGLSLLVFAHNENAIALYKKFGFRQIEYYEADVIRSNGDAWDTILMRKDLRQP
ncbi:MAG: N-acetyltransferase family protein [Candidatus Baltobacteraceae bacterium]